MSAFLYQQISSQTSNAKALDQDTDLLSINVNALENNDSELTLTRHQDIPCLDHQQAEQFLALEHLDFAICHTTNSNKRIRKQNRQKNEPRDNKRDS